MIHRLVGASEPSLIFGLNLIKCGIKFVAQDGRKQFVQRWQSTHRAIVSDIFSVPSQWITFSVFLRHVSGVQLSCLNTSLKICFIIPFVANVIVLDVFGTDSIVVAGFAFLEFVDCCLNFFICDHGYFSVSSSPLFFSHRQPWYHGSRYFETFLQFQCCQIFCS